MEPRRRILLLYTGGTIGMQLNPATGALAPFDFAQIQQAVPEVSRYDFEIESESLLPLLDSSDATPAFWVRLAERVQARYDSFDGFVILHGTDTMSYTASALSFMLPDLSKPVVLTGSQLPIGAVRTDGRENLLGALEVASCGSKVRSEVPEVSIFFNHRLLRGNRSVKLAAHRFEAFKSYNYPLLAEAGISIRYNERVILRRPIPPRGVGRFFRVFDTRVASLRLYPGISSVAVEAVLRSRELRGVVLSTYGAGNAPSHPWLLKELQEAIDRGVLIVNVSQCLEGHVDMSTYDVGLQLERIGVISGADMTFEGAITKLMLALGQSESREEALRFFRIPLAGEMRLIPPSGDA